VWFFSSDRSFTCVIFHVRDRHFSCVTLAEFTDFEDGTDSCSETSVRNCHHTLPNMQEELRSQIFLTPPKRPDRHWGPPSVLYNSSRGSLEEVKRKDLNAEVTDKVWLYVQTTHAVISRSWIQWEETHIITLNKHGSCATDIGLWAPAGTSTPRCNDWPTDFHPQCQLRIGQWNSDSPLQCAREEFEAERYADC